MSRFCSLFLPCLDDMHIYSYISSSLENGIPTNLLFMQGDGRLLQLPKRMLHAKACKNHCNEACVQQKCLDNLVIIFCTLWRVIEEAFPRAPFITFRMLMWFVFADVIVLASCVLYTVVFIDSPDIEGRIYICLLPKTYYTAFLAYIFWFFHERDVDALN